MNAQNNKPLAIKEYGSITLYDSPVVVPSKNKEYKVVYRITKDIEKEGVNKGLWQIARLINLLNAYDVPKENIHIIALISGKGYPVAFTNEAHLKRYKKENPNIDLVSKLMKHDVEFHLCGQTVVGNKINYSKDINSKIKLTLSAMIDVIEYSKKDYVVFE